MTRLILIRHAKSAWDDPTMADHDRPLAPRGIAATLDLGQWLASRGYIPDEVLCSDAVRTQETWAGITKELPQSPEPLLKPALYHAGPDVMLAVLRHAKSNTVAMLGHNPGIAEFAHRLVAQAPISDQFGKYPTGATLVVDFTMPWAEVEFGSGTVVDFVVPRELVA